jgi:negative regulator of sigma E activity
MDTAHLETLSAFFDGERVDPERLAESLDQPGAADLLAEFAAMRAQASEDPCRPSPDFLERASGQLRHAALQRWWWERVTRGGLAACLALAVGVFGYVLGTINTGGRGPGVAPSPPPVVASRPVEAPAVSPEPRPPATAVAKAPVRSGQAVGGPPVPSLRLRLGEWHDTTPLIAEEPQRQ